MATGASGSSAAQSIANAPYWPSPTPGTPIRAWATASSAGERRGNDGTVGTSKRSNENRAAWPALRCGRLPTPNVAPGATRSKKRRDAADSAPAGGNRKKVTPTCCQTAGVSDDFIRVCRRTPANLPADAGRVPIDARDATLWAVFDSDRIRRAVPWLLRLVWIAVLVAGGAALDDALAGAGDTAATATRWLALGGWVLGVAAMAIPAPVTLTLTRDVVPASVVVAGVTWVAGADVAPGALFVGLTVLASVVAGSSALGRAFVQASAYGAEDRHLLRPPLPYLLVAVLAWALWAAAVVVTGVAAAQGSVWIAIVAGTIALVGGALGLPRWNRLARRFLVIVPAGLVVHDHVVLAETLMFRRQEIARLGLALAGTDAADFTGPAPGHAVEIRTAESVTALVSMVPGAPRGGAIHLTACLVAPTRPGQFLASAAARRLPVGALD